MIVVDHLSKRFGNNHVLNDISLSFGPGMVYGMVGKNGAGKTTFFKCLAGLESYEGKIQFNGGEQLRHVLGFLPTDPYFLPKITGREYLQLLCNARGVRHKDFDEKNVFDLPLNRYAETYSTGMKKKLALTAILLQPNEVFILDEPFNGVDMASNLLIKSVIVKLKTLNKILIVSSHIFSTLTETCDCMHLMDKGVITRTAGKESFASIETDMTGADIFNRLDQLDLH